jgi:hypothetical protein
MEWKPAKKRERGCPRRDKKDDVDKAKEFRTVCQREIAVIDRC